MLGREAQAGERVSPRLVEGNGDGGAAAAKCTIYMKMDNRRVFLSLVRKRREGRIGLRREGGEGGCGRCATSQSKLPPTSKVSFISATSVLYGSFSNFSPIRDIAEKCQNYMSAIERALWLRPQNGLKGCKWIPSFFHFPCLPHIIATTFIDLSHVLHRIRTPC